jgi:hypothetical protein
MTSRRGKMSSIGQNASDVRAMVFDWIARIQYLDTYGFSYLARDASDLFPFFFKEKKEEGGRGGGIFLFVYKRARKRSLASLAADLVAKTPIRINALNASSQRASLAHRSQLHRPTTLLPGRNCPMTGPALTDHQAVAIDAVLRLLETEPVVALGGLAGTGKSSSLPILSNAGPAGPWRLRLTRWPQCGRASRTCLRFFSV